MVGYNLTGIAENTTSILDFMQGVNTQLTFGWLFIFILIGLAIILFTSFFYVTKQANKSLAATAWLCFILSVLLRAADLIPNIVLIISLIIAAGTLAFTWKKD